MNENFISPDIITDLRDELPDLHAHVQHLMPEIYHDGDGYCCLSGFNNINGIFGFGKTPKDAVKDWDMSYQTAKIHGSI